MGDEVRVKGKLYGWPSTVLKIGGEGYRGFTSITWDEKRERVLGYGMGKSYAPYGQSGGKYTPGVLKMSGYPSSESILKAQLAALTEDGRSYGNVEVPITLQLVEGDEVITHEWDECAIISNAGSAEESPDPLKGDVEFSFVRHREIAPDGTVLTLYDSSEEGR